jgi:hypothetical protein
MPKTLPNGNYITKGICKECGKGKCQFGGGIITGPPDKSPVLQVGSGQSIIDKLINSGKLPELHFRGFDSGFKPYNFAGPGTHLHKRLDPITKKPLPHSKPINRVDESAYNHDLMYDMWPDNERRKVADDLMIEDLSNIRKDKSARWQERADATIVEGFMRAKRFLGLGKKRRQTIRKARRAKRLKKKEIY